MPPFPRVCLRITLLSILYEARFLSYVVLYTVLPLLYVYDRWDWDGTRNFHVDQVSLRSSFEATLTDFTVIH